MDKRELELYWLGKHVNDKQSLQMAPYPCDVSFITSYDEWDGLMTYLQQTDPRSNAEQYIGELKRVGPTVVYLECNNDCVFVIGMMVYDPAHTVEYYSMMIGSFSKLVQRMIMMYSDKIGHEVQPSANPSAAILDWAIRQWMAVLSNRFNGISTFVPENIYRLGSLAPELANAAYLAYKSVGETAAINALQRECHALVNHTVTPTNTGWHATTYLTGGDK
jgi:hypothetical protein